MQSLRLGGAWGTITFLAFGLVAGLLTFLVMLPPDPEAGPRDAAALVVALLSIWLGWRYLRGQWQTGLYAVSTIAFLGVAVWPKLSAMAKLPDPLALLATSLLIALGLRFRGRIADWDVPVIRLLRTAHGFFSSANPLNRIVETIEGHSKLDDFNGLLANLHSRIEGEQHRISMGQNWLALTLGAASLLAAVSALKQEPNPARSATRAPSTPPAAVTPAPEPPQNRGPAVTPVPRHPRIDPPVVVPPEDSPKTPPTQHQVPAAATPGASAAPAMEGQEADVKSGVGPSEAGARSNAGASAGVGLPLSNKADDPNTP